MKRQDEIVEEVRRARKAYAARFDYDLRRMFEDLKEKERQNPGPHADFSSRTRHGPRSEAIP